jgi:short subunit dehydrogenase-like uncharacterized protein
MAEKRPYDIVLFGAIGFTGRLTAQYLTGTHGRQPFTWALAGRDLRAVEEVRKELKAIDSSCDSVGVIRAHAFDPEALAEMSAQARVVISTVGPYAVYGEALVAACVKTGTDYVDLAGEPQFVDNTIQRHGAQAREAGVRIVNCCGFDSIPHDLGALFTVNQLPADQPIRLQGFVRASGTYSGGTWHSLVHALSRYGEYKKQRRGRPRPEAGEGRHVGSTGERIHFQRALGSWACPFPTIDRQVIKRSARAMPKYGPDFRYGHYLQVKKMHRLLGGMVGFSGVYALARFEPTRNWLLKKHDPGEGPDSAQREKGWFQVTFIGETSAQTVMTRVSGGDPGYDETSKMLAESALCLAFDELPERAGVITPAQAMGQVLMKRLQNAGIRFEMLENGG